MGLFTKVTDYFDGKRDREIADIERRMELSRYQRQLVNLYRYLVNEKKKEQFAADIYGAGKRFTKLKEDVSTVQYLIDRCAQSFSKEEFIENNREDIEHIFSKYRDLLYPMGR